MAGPAAQPIEQLGPPLGELCQVAGGGGRQVGDGRDGQVQLHIVAGEHFDAVFCQMRYQGRHRFRYTRIRVTAQDRELFEFAAHVRLEVAS